MSVKIRNGMKMKLKIYHLLEPREKTSWMEQMSTSHFFHAVTFTELNQANRAPQTMS